MSPHLSPEGSCRRAQHEAAPVGPHGSPLGPYPSAQQPVSAVTTLLFARQPAPRVPGTEAAPLQPASPWPARLPGQALRWIAPAAEDEPALLFLPPSPATRPAPLVVCVHGYTRQPMDQLQAFAPLAAARGCALVLPLFDERRHRRYQQLLHPRRGTRSDLGLLRALARLAAASALDDRRLFLFGYSGGGQFVHRFAMCHPERTAALAVGAAGWYTWPDTQAAWPTGLGGSAEAMGQPIDLDAFLRLPMALWVGERDNVADRLLRSEPGLVEQQGAHRLERAQRWAAAVRAAARARGLHQPAPVHLLSQVGHDFAACHRRGDMAGQVMDFFDQHRARP